MRKIIFSFVVLVLATMCFTSCSSLGQSVDDSSPVDVQVFISGLTLSTEPLAAPVRRASDTQASQAGIKFITFTAFGSQGTTPVTITQSSSDTDFGTINLTLAAGTYTFVAVANNGTSAATISSASSAAIAYQERMISYSCVKANVAISGSTSQTVMDMGTRDNAVFSVQITDAVPTTVSQIQIIVNPSVSAPSPLVINPSTGLVADEWKYMRSMPRTSVVNVTDNSNYEIGLPVFLTAVTQQLDVTINSLDADGNVLYTRSLQNVNFKQACKTKATGSLFSSSASLLFDTTYGDDIEVSLN